VDSALNWNEIRAGLNIRIIDPINSRSGELTERILIWLRQVSWLCKIFVWDYLTDPPKSNGHYMLLEPEKQALIIFKRFQLLE
jgi:hypothetical protein